MHSGWDGQELLSPIAEDKPCGENLDDAPVLAALDALRLWGQVNSPETPPEPGENKRTPDWRQMRADTLAALSKSKDLRVLAYLAAAMLRTDGLPAFFATITVASRWLDAYWSDVYPLLDEDAIARQNALNCLSDKTAVVDRVRRIPLVESRQHGRFSLRDIEIATGVIQPGAHDVKADEAPISAAFAEMPLEQLRGLEQGCVEAKAAMDSIDARMRAQGGADVAPEFDALAKELQKVLKLAREKLALRPDAVSPVEEEAAAEQGVEAAAGGSAGGRHRGVGSIESRDDVIRALDAIIDYLKRNEPASPVPMFLERGKRLVSKSFLEVLADIAPEAVDAARAAGGVKPE